MEWQNVSRHLKELNDSNFPSSQMCIEWNWSEDEEAVSPKRKKLLLKNKKKNKHSLALEASLNNKKDEFAREIKFLNMKDSTEIVHDESKSPVFKIKAPKCSSPRLTINFKRTLVEIDNSLNEINTLNTSPIFKCSDHKFKTTCAEKTSFDQNLFQNEVIQSGMFPEDSPILKSRMKAKNARSEGESNQPENKCEVVTKPCGQKNLNTAFNSTKETEKCIRNETQQNLTVNEHLKTNANPCEFTNRNKCLSSQCTPQLREFDLVITECMSPTSDLIKEIDSSSSSLPSVESKKSDIIILEDLTKQQKGSEWVKDVQYKTPEKVFDPSITKSYPTEVPDSSRKKIKRNGLADQLRKYLQSWHSSFFMWDHQMSLEATRQENSCSGSPPLDHMNSPKKCLNLSSDCLHVTEPKMTIAGSDFRVKCPPPGTLSTKDFNISKSSKPTCVKESPDSLEILSLHESPLLGLTPRNKLPIPKTHVCVEVIKIEWQTVVMVSALCREVDNCLQKIKKETYPVLPRILLGIFGYLDFKSIKRLEAGDRVKIFAPWQLLEVKTLAYPALFSSRFTSSRRSKVEFKPNEVKVTSVASWQCSCTLDFTVLPFSCLGGKLQIHASDTDYLVQSPKQNPLTCSRVFSAMRDSPDTSSSKVNCYWTVLEAVEMGSGKLDASVSVTLKVWRIYPRKNSANDDEPSCFLILGQDPSGVFLLVEVPNRPQIVTLSSLLQKSLSTTHTLTHLTIEQRITDVQYPSLFSLIHSLEIFDKQFISSSPQLLPYFREYLKRPPQSFCYKFAVLLGETSNIMVIEAEHRSLSLPHWNIEEELKLDTGTRGCILTYILYYVQPHLYVSNQHQGKFTCLYKFVVKDSVWLPPWMNCDGTIMTQCVLEDIAVWHGSLIVDEFTRIQRIKAEVPVSLQDILGLVSEISASSASYDLVSVKGFVKDVNGEEACCWDECCICGALDLYQGTSNNIKCQQCQTEDVSTITKYSVEVILHLASIDRPPLRLKIKLFQTTIKTLLKGLQSQNNQYKMDDLLGITVGPLICVIKSLEENRFAKTFNLDELPY